MSLENKLKSAILGLAIGDALGVPYEFISRDIIKKNPCIDMIGYGTHNKSAGTWSDDTSLTLCLLDNLNNKNINYNDIMDSFALWYNNGKYTADGNTFDVGMTTREAINNYKIGKNPIKCGLYDEYSNGNGSLMRILPIAFYIKKYFNSQLFESSEVINIIYNISSLTHSHKRSLIACVIYTAIALNLINDMNIEESINKALKDSFDYYKNEKEINYYKRIFGSDFKNLNDTEIESSGYVVHTLEASIWILLNTSNYKDAVLKAVNLGDDTDTTAAVTGGLAALYYGVDNIPSNWIDTLINKELIINICSNYIYWN
ncbi:ADP-ribosylglycohydrolase family protein [Brachyspira hyodysenteriae]|uniref:ADP-ribosylglycohydrolase family protein n=1 Tax=Brachyspira hyodysenteriae TaxID=159 RepID=UPI002B25990F|nr:ADP-ribosylglycohydrolase family protein [Brachyspira hyodysenteriae]WPC38384.1 ADP-ribosylglycohydrolase family protein [Brachyspira hyodysenteriae]